MRALTRSTILLAVASAALACRGRSDSGPARADSGVSAAGRAVAAETAAGGGAPAGDGHGEPGGEEAGSDLDRPVEALFAASCEHGKKAFECDECRYSVGVVRVPARIVDDGLVRVVRPERRRVEAPVALTGEVRLDERRVTHVAPRVEGALRRVHASLGERVRRGDPLVELESEQAGQAESEHEAAQAALRLAQAAFERQEQLRAERISSEKEYLAARQEHEAARIRARAAEERLRRLGAAPGDAARRAAGGRSGVLVVRAPSDGVVLEMHAAPGELVRPDESIVTLGEVSSVWVWADLHEDQLGPVLDAQGGRLAAGIAVKAFPGATFPGTVDFVGPTMDERTRTVKVRISVPNPDGKLRAGMFANVSLWLPGAEEALALPAAAVLADEGRSFAFLRHHGEYWVRRPVEVGRRWAGWVEVTRGLQGGEEVAGEGAFLLKSDVLRSKMGAGCAD